MTPLLDVRSLSKTSPGFREELVRMAGRLSLDPSLIAAVMSRESGFNPSARNPHTQATGLIQFMPATARGLGTSVEALFLMSATKQLEFVERYYRPFAGRLRAPGDYYMAVFMPAHVGDPPETILFTKPEIGYAQNAGLDLDKDGTITVGDVTRAIEQTVSEARGRPPLLVDEDIPKEAPGAGSSAPSSSSGSPGPSSGEPSKSNQESAAVVRLPTLHRGDHGPAVRLWQKLVNRSATNGVMLDEDGNFGPLTEGATKQFQKFHALIEDGVVLGPVWEAA